MAPNIYTSPYPTPSVPADLSITQFLLQTSPDDAPPDKVIFADFDDPSRQITYQQLRAEASRDAATLKNSFGLETGDVVCIYAQNSLEWVSLAHATLWAGGCFCGVNPLATKFELEHYFKLAEPKIIIVDAPLLVNVEYSLSELKSSAKIVVISNDSSSKTSYATYPQSFSRSESPSIEPHDLAGQHNHTVPAAMCFSSGTSGLPKAVMLSQHNLIAQLLTVRATNPFTHNIHTAEAFFPSFSHVYGIVSGLLIPAWTGSYLQPMPKFEFLPYVQRCADLRASVMRLVPAAAVRLAKDPGIRDLDLTCVRTVMCSGAALSEETVDGLRKILAEGVAVLNGYGMSETTLTLLRETRRDKGASVGRPAAGVSLRIVDDDFNDVHRGEDGECIIKGPTVFMGYKNNSTETANTFRDGWLMTGDVVRADDEGFFYLTGRKKELIKFKGNQIAPTELEAVLSLHPAVAEAGACGVFDKKLDTEIPVGFIILSEQEEPGDEGVLEAIRSFVNERVAPYKRFREPLTAVKSLPKNTSGKLLRRHLTALATEARSRKQKL